ncbi:gliding motility-associated C-terminal domain-containing protein [Tenacibaculum sp. HL-MS23]|uniref:T9SS type B sorting domain-containing protein n=1 Tax=Tenacibaculum sp. HL-MS23 TaxID=3077734 RepID=UPI0028FC1D55|nr:gliding motility-associated C-terminal domain-containing protein [Tenacibaculum sp. HL-MS23]WNW02156.1 gliding motility-associated C-terminal domain-containing protein [Tenacibaculum sp. HL-MS23]
MNKITRSIQILLGMLLICIQCNTMLAQTLNTPVIAGGGSACDTSGATDFPVDFSFSGSVFDDENVFFIELSDVDGSFADASLVKELRRLESTAANNFNQAFNISTTIQLPDGTFGKNYKIRIRTTSPEMTSESVFFEAYHDMVVDSELGINNDEDFALCNGESKEVSLTTTIIGEYQWFRRVGSTDTLVATTQDPTFTITQAGTYFVVIDYGSCGGPKSRFINAIGISNSDAQITGTATVEICGDEAHTFTASSNNTNYTYEWYQDDVLKQTSNSNTYTTPTAGQFGTYHLIVKLGDCEVKSNDVVLAQQTTADFNVNTIGALKTIILPDETRELCITHDATSATIQWYKDDSSMGASANQLCVSARASGEYFARVTKTSATTCNLIVDSEKYELIAVKSFDVTIRAETAYEECNTVTTDLSIVGVTAIGQDDEQYDLSADQIDMLNYQWKKDGVAVTGATETTYNVGSYQDNGVYTLQVGVGTLTTDSNELAIKLIVEDPEITSTSSSNSLCPGGNIIYTIDVLVAGYTYEWFKDDDTKATATDVTDFAVTEIGEYTLKITGFGCEKTYAPINVVLFDESVVMVTPSEKVVLIQGQTVTVTASGAESYVWHLGEDTAGTVLSTNETLDVTTLGFYTVEASVGACSVILTIEVVEQDDQVIVPNIVTPNEDGINDTWQLSNKYAFQPSVVIQLYDSSGKEILNTTDYKNDWPLESLGNQKIFYYKIIKEDVLIKAGTISVLD